MERDTEIYNYNDYSSSDYNSTKRNGQNDVKKLVIGALAGAAVGTLVGSLYTEKGVEIRHNLGERSREIANNVKEKASDITTGIKDKVSDVTTPIANGYQSTKKVATKIFAKSKPKDSISTLKSEYDSYNSDEVEISTTKVIAAVIAASVAGLVVWSFTTEKGKTTRKRAIKGTQEVAGKLKVQASKLAEEVKKGYEVAKEGAQELMERQRQLQQHPANRENAYATSTSDVSANTF